jgi:lipopolysaccharide/colanic/teichoic acid biosynthesis glycosyltransferase
MDYAKRVMDLALILLVFPGVAFLMLAVAVAICFSRKRPVFFVQSRIGLKGRVFRMVKFRTMKDGKVHGFGKLLRRTSLDELPEVYNVIRGDMSLVGPRPLLLEYGPFYTDAQWSRHNVLPGITGLAQVNGRDNLTWDAKLQLDIEYVKNRSLLLDIQILLKTVWVTLAQVGNRSIDPAKEEKFSEFVKKKTERR